MQSKDTYMEPIVFQYPGMTIRVHRPILTDEERARRMKLVHDAAADLLKSGKK